MKRAEIKEQISECLIECTCIIGADLEQLTDLFIELSAELCRKQKSICFNQFSKAESTINKGVAILNAPLPEIK